MNLLFYLVPLFGVIALLYTFVQSSWVSKQPAGNDRMKTISGHIADGAMAFLKAEYRILTYFVIVVGILLGIMGFSKSCFFGNSRLYRNENRNKIKCKNCRSG